MTTQPQSPSEQEIDRRVLAILEVYADEILDDFMRNIKGKDSDNEFKANAKETRIMAAATILALFQQAAKGDQ